MKPNSIPSDGTKAEQRADVEDASVSPFFAKPNVSGSIVLTKIEFRETMLFHSKSYFFREPICCKITSDKIILSQVGVLYSGKVISVSFNKKDKRFTGTLKVDCPNGEYFFDEDESTSDMVVIYYR